MTVDAPFFHGEYELSLDVKNRMQIPADVRRALDAETHGETLFMTMGPNGVPWLYARKHYIALVNQRPTDMMPNEALTDYARLKFGMCVEVAWDPQGRTVLPDKTVKRSKLGKELTLVGVGEHLELWNRDQWESYGENLRTKTAEVELRARLARLTQVPSSAIQAPAV